MMSDKLPEATQRAIAEAEASMFIAGQRERTIIEHFGRVMRGKFPHHGAPRVPNPERPAIPGTTDDVVDIGLDRMVDAILFNGEGAMFDWSADISVEAQTDNAIRAIGWWLQYGEKFQMEHPQR